MRASVKLVPLVVTQSLFSSCARYAAAQVIEDASIVYTTVGGWDDMRACARCPFQVRYNICGAGDFLNDAIGCMTNACLRRASTLEEAVEFIDERVISLCSNYDDQSTASEFLVRYCSTHGYTSVGTAATPTGAFLTTTVTVTKTIATETIFRSDAGEFPRAPSLILVSSETTASQASSHDVQETISTTQSEFSPTSNPSSSQRNTLSSPITSPPSTGSTIGDLSPTTSASPTTESSDDGLKTSDLIGIIVGVLGLFVAVLTLWVSWRTGRPKKLWRGVTG
ncbi:hypothetical protein O1611_g863 [Lasiodiplodia mahajangana]|uniref:Uncharacterized protein n=1 Tax=Lasiodiplodia mahajangana TaxID=1108764 RepID=A0ACC2JZA7_9PEZI|nr:hypothetical protein O1611_g863 [Lasiodiplodia mahajangana]